MTTTTTTLAELPSLTGGELGTSDWIEVTQDRVDTLADAAMAVDYGMNEVRFPAPVPVGSKIRLTATLADVVEITGGYQVTASCVIEAEGAAKPVCIAEPVFRFLG